MTDKWHPNPAPMIAGEIDEQLVMSSVQIGKTDKATRWRQMREWLATGKLTLPTPEQQRAELKRAGMTWIDEASSIRGDWFKSAWLRACKERDDQVRDCLERWVSECEPTQIMRDGQFLGLGLDGGDGAVIVAAKPAPSGPMFIAWDLARD